MNISLSKLLFSIEPDSGESDAEMKYLLWEEFSKKISADKEHKDKCFP